jgi:hypothetical protein
MELKDDVRVGTRAGTRVRVQVDYRRPHRQGAIGTIKKRYGAEEYTAFEVLFADGQTELFWEHQLEEATEEEEECFPRTKKKRWRRWIFW